MHSNQTHEFAIGGTIFLIAQVSNDDATLAWIRENWAKMFVVSVLATFVAFVSCCLKWPTKPGGSWTTGIPIVLARMMAAGIIGCAAVTMSGSLFSIGSGPGFTAAIIVLAGAGGYVVLAGIGNLFTRARDDANFQASLLSWIWKRYCQFRGWPATTEQPPMPAPKPLTPEERIATRIPEKHLPESFDNVKPAEKPKDT